MEQERQTADRRSPIASFQGGEAPGLGAHAYRPFDISGVRGPDGLHPVTESLPLTLTWGRMRMFSRTGVPRRSVLVVTPLSGAFPVLMRDLIVALLEQADRVAVTDWPDARYLPLERGACGFDVNCGETLRMIDLLEGPHHVVGVCQGVVPALAASVLLAQGGRAPLSLTLLGGPVDPGAHPTRLGQMLSGMDLIQLAETVMLRVPPLFPGAGRKVFPRQRQMQAFGLYLWRQTLNGGELPLKLLMDDGDDPLHFPLARLCWDMMDIPAEFFIENVTRVFKDRALVHGRLNVAGWTVTPAALTRTVLLTVEGTADDIAGPGQTHAAHDVCRNLPPQARRRLTLEGAGHFSLFHGARMRREILPAIGHAMAAAESREG